VCTSECLPSVPASNMQPADYCDNVSVYVYVADKWFLYPEQDPNSNYYLPAIGKRPNFGIAVSGGGYRAVTLALGYVRCVRHHVPADAGLCRKHTYCLGSRRSHAMPLHPLKHQALQNTSLVLISHHPCHSMSQQEAVPVSYCMVCVGRVGTQVETGK